MFRTIATSVISAAMIAAAAPSAIAAPSDTTVCYRAESGQWASDYTRDGRCTFGSPFDNFEHDSRMARMAISLAATIGKRHGDNREARIVPAHYLQYVNECPDIDVVYVHVPTRTLYGDQDGNGKLDGEDCNWR